MKDNTALKITHLEGYAGLRLKDEKNLEIKKGINLLVGRNGSGKSALTNLVEFNSYRKVSSIKLRAKESSILF